MNVFVYIAGFTLSTFLVRLAQQYSVKTKDIRFLVLSFLAMLIPCYIAGCRALTIGTDVEVYASPMFDIAKGSDSFENFLNTTWYMVYVKKSISDIELGYNIIVYIAAKVFGSVQVLLFLTEVLVIVPVYIALVKMRKQLPMWVGVLTFYLMYYNLSLNIMRQSIGMAFILLAFSYLFNESKKGFVICFLIAFLFHKTSLLGIVVLFIYLYMVKERSLKSQSSLLCVQTVTRNIYTKKGKVVIGIGTHKLMIITVIGILTIVFYQIVISVLDKLGFSFYTRYLLGGVSYLPKQIIVRLPFLIIAMLVWKVLKENKLSLFYVALVIIDILMSQLAGADVQAIRVAMFFGIFNVFLVPMLYLAAPKKYRKIIRLFINIYLIAYWLYYFVLKASGETYPYIFYR